MSAEILDTLVIGAGVVGLAIARAEALTKRSVLVLERAAHFGMETSSRNSEVIHAGIYYTPGLLKAQMCVAGKEKLYAFCDARAVPYRRCGKLIVAANAEQQSVLDGIAANARACGVEDLVPLTKAQVAAIEPDVACEMALFSPSTGIIDSHAYMLALLGEAEAHGAQLVCNTKVRAIRQEKGSWAVYIEGEDAPVVQARTIINAAGLGAQAIAHAIEGFPADAVPGLWYAKGDYFTYGGKVRFRHLIYPVPEPGGLGTHLTLDMAGQARFGPNVQWTDAIDYAVDPDGKSRFAQAASRFWPGIDADKLSPGYAGIRPKISPPGAPAADFLISGPADHGVAGIINLFGIESPGLTSSLAIADHVARLHAETL